MCSSLQQERMLRDTHSRNSYSVGYRRNSSGIHPSSKEVRRFASQPRCWNPGTRRTGPCPIRGPETPGNLTLESSGKYRREVSEGIGPNTGTQQYPRNTPSPRGYRMEGKAASTWDSISTSQGSLPETDTLTGVPM